MEEQTKIALRQWLEPKYAFSVLAILAVTGVVVVSILRDRLVNPSQNQVAITGQGKISYQPDTATVTLGVQVDKAPTAEAALGQLNDKMGNIVASVETLGIKKEDIQTQAYTLSPQYNYMNNVTTLAGYSANQKISIRVSDIQNNPDRVSKVIAGAGASGTNQVQGIDFTVSNLNDLKQQARVLAIQDAKAKSAALAAAAGVKLGKIESWFENVLASPDVQFSGMGLGAGPDTAVKAIPQVPSGTQDIIIEISLTYEVK
jgi:uncharacterized protein YggE